VVERIGQVAYRLALPADARLHDVFHVGLLKPFHGTPPSVVPPLPAIEDGRVLPTPARVLRTRRVSDSWELHVCWEGVPVEEATWEPLEDLKTRFPDFQLEDELFVEEGRDVMAQPAAH
jgi:hypothetical protein